MDKKFDKEEIIKKVNDGVPITREEDRFYMLEVLGFPVEVVDNIFVINDNNEITAKLNSGTPLTREEEIYYLTKILNHTPQEALNILAIANNNNLNLIID